jgi:hypothetical protein
VSRVSVRGVSKPDGADGRESVWARIERENREDAKRARGPLAVMWTGFALLAIPNLAPVFGHRLPAVAFWAVICLSVGLGTAGLSGTNPAVADREPRGGRFPCPRAARCGTADLATPCTNTAVALPGSDALTTSSARLQAGPTVAHASQQRVIGLSWSTHRRIPQNSVHRPLRSGLNCCSARLRANTTRLSTKRFSSLTKH